MSTRSNKIELLKSQNDDNLLKHSNYFKLYLKYISLYVFSNYERIYKIL